jgi:hypothetical protein
MFLANPLAKDLMRQIALSLDILGRTAAIHLGLALPIYCGGQEKEDEK